MKNNLLFLKKKKQKDFWTLGPRRWRPHAHGPVSQKLFAAFFQKSGAFFALNVGAVSLAEGVRAGIAVAVTVLAGALLGLPHFGLAALGALLTCFADPGGPVRRRVPAVLAFAVTAGIAYAAFGLVRASGPGLAAPIAGLAIFCACFARIYGQSGLQVGNLLGVVIVLALDGPAGSLGQAAGQGLNMFAGALWAALLTLVIWRLHPYRPSRVALAQVSVTLGALAKDLAALADARETVLAFEAHAARHRRGVREAIEVARGVALDTFRRRGVVSRRAATMAVRLQTMEQMFGGLIALSDVLENDAAGRGAAARPVRLVAAWLRALGPEIEADMALDSPKKRASLARLRAEIEKLSPDGAAARLLGGMAEQIDVLMRVSAPAGQSLSGAARVLPWRTRVLSPIRQNLHVTSAPMRHALRAAVIVTPVLFCTMAVHQTFAHWAAITLILCLQPYFSATRARAVERIMGTALGGGLAAGIGFFAQTQIALAFTMLPLTIFAFTIRGVSYGAFVAALTPMVVLLVEQIAPGANEMSVAVLRIFYTLLGGSLAVAGSLLLWPGFEHARLDTSIEAAKAAHAAFVTAVFGALLDQGTGVDTARRHAGLASNNLEAALARALAEPHRGGDLAIARGAIVDAALRRMAGRLAVLVVDPPVIPPAQIVVWRAWRDWLVAALGGVVAARPISPAGPDAEALLRLARQVELISG